MFNHQYNEMDVVKKTIKIGCAWVIVYFLIWLTLVVGIIATAVHFIHKY